MRLYRERFAITATATSFNVTAATVPIGFIRLYEGRVLVNATAPRGLGVAYLGNPANLHIIGAGVLVTGSIAGVGISEEAGHRTYGAGEYWTFQFSGFVTGDVVILTLMGTEVPVFDYDKGVVP
jgi:hypothetical protein